MRRAALAIIAFTLAPGRAQAEVARATRCPVPGRPWIKVESADARFVESLRTELAMSGFDVCAEADADAVAPIATVSVTARDDGVTIEVSDDVVTAKRVARDVDLGSIPADGRPLALALAADELLRASWVELTLVDAPAPRAPVPEPVRQTVESSVRPVATPPPARSGAMSVMFAGEGFAGGQLQWGGDARAEWFVTPHFAATLRLGLRSALPKRAAEGEVRASAILGGLGVAYGVVPSGRVGLDLFTRFDVADVTYAADTTVDAKATSGSAVALLASVGGQVGWSITPALRLSGEVGAIAPLRPVRATEAQTDVVFGVSGAGALVGIGAGGLF